METKVASGGQPKRVGKWTLSQLRQTDGRYKNKIKIQKKYIKIKIHLYLGKTQNTKKQKI